MVKLMVSAMPSTLPCRRWFELFLSAGLFLPGVSASAQDNVVPQTVLSPCATVREISREALVAGTGLAVSPDGRWLALYAHTNRGGEVTMRLREGNDLRRLVLVPPALPAGVVWRVIDAAFSPRSDLLAIRSVGAVWIIDVASGKSLHQIELDSKRQIYPGKLSFAADKLAVLFWPAESYLADVPAKKGVEVRLYEAATGKLLRTLTLAVESSEEWVVMQLSPDAMRIAILRRATRWPGKAQLEVFSADTGQRIWEAKTSAEDFQWSTDGTSIFALGRRLVTLDAATGKQKSVSKAEFGPSENQKLRASEAANLALGQLSRYSRVKRSFGKSAASDSMIVLWQLSTAAPLCHAPLSPAQSAQPWITADGEIILLEESYELRPPLRLLKSAQIVTYRLVPK